MTKDLRKYLPGWNPTLKTVVPVKKAGKNAMVIKQDKLRESYAKASDRLERAQKTGMVATPARPRLREVQVPEPFKSIAANIGCDGLDLQYIMKELSTSDNEGLIKAFKQFIMLAKLSVEDAMAQANEVRKDVQIQNVMLNGQWRNDVERVEKTNAETQRELRLSETAHRKIWVKLLDDLKTALDRDRVLENLHYFDQLFIECLRDKVGKSTVMIRDGKVYPNFKNLEMLKSQIGEDVLKRVQKKIENHESVQTSRWLNSAKNADLLWAYMSDHADELELYETNNLMRIYLGHKKRIVLVCRDGRICDGGVWTKGTPPVIWEDHPTPRHILRNTTHRVDMSGEDVWQVFDLIDHYRKY